MKRNVTLTSNVTHTGSVEFSKQIRVCVIVVGLMVPEVVVGNVLAVVVVELVVPEVVVGNVLAVVVIGVGIVGGIVIGVV